MRAQLDAIALSYEAALEPDKWPEALDAIAIIGQAKGAFFGLNDTSNHALYNFGLFSGSLPENKVQEYLQTHIEFESKMWAAAVQHLNKAPEYTGVSMQTLFEEDGSRYDAQAEKDILEILGVSQRFAVMLNHNAPWSDGIALQYGDESADIPAHAFANISKIAPYFTRIVSVVRPAYLLQAEHGMMLDVLDKLAIGVAVVSSDGTLILKNVSFEQILDLDSLYLDPSMRLRAYENNLDATLRRSMSGTSKMSVGLEFDRGEYISVPVKDRPHPVSLEVSPLGRSGKDSPLTGWSIIFAIDPHWRLVTDTENLAQSYSLTTTEKEVCSMLLKGFSNREIGEVRSVRMETVKSHVSNLLAKTYTKNRTELARLAAIAEIPLLG